MKKLILLPLLLWAFGLFAANPSFQQTTNVVIGVSSNQENIFVSSTIVLGTGAAVSRITSTNGPAENGLPLTYWSDYTDYNTNKLQLTNNPSSPQFNQIYSKNSSLSWTNSINARTITNRIDFSATNVLGSGISNYWALVSAVGGTPTQVSSNLLGQTWVSFAAGTNTFMSTFFQTNVVWKLMAWGGSTNISQLTNGSGGWVFSNSVPYLVTSAVGSTNQTWQILTPNAGFVTNSLIASGSAIPLANNAVSNVTSLALPFNGTWMISGKVNFSTSTATTTGTAGAIAVTSATLPSDGSETFSGVQVTLISETDSLTPEASQIIVTTGTTNIYLVGRCSFSAGSVSAYGALRAVLLK